MSAHRRPDIRSTAAVAEHYDELDPFYREIWGDHVHHGLWLSGNESPHCAVEQLVHEVARRAGIASGDRVCDVGCGYGATARLLAREFGAEVTGITVSRAQYARASDAGATGNPTFVLGDWIENDLPSGAFDSVIAIESTEHMADQRACFDQAYRVLRPDGSLVVCAWFADRQARRWEQVGLLEPIRREGRMPGMGHDDEICRRIEQAGFRDVGLEDLTPRVKRTWSICIARTLPQILRRKEYRAFLLSPTTRNRSFALTPLRIWLAYETGAMRYGLFTARKPR